MSYAWARAPPTAIQSYFRDWTTFEKIWLVLFSAVASGTYVFGDETLIGLFAALTGIITVVLAAKGRISNYYFGLVNVVLYAYLAYQSQYYGELMLNVLYYLPMQFVGLFIWTQNSTKRDTVAPNPISTRERLGWAVGAVVGIIGYGYFLKYLQGHLPYIDATSTVLSVLAMLLMVRRAAEQWVVWMAINIISIYMWVDVLQGTGSGATMVAMWSAYLVNSVYGWYNWKYNLAEA